MDNAKQPAQGAATSVTPSAAASHEADLTGQVLGEFRLLHRLGSGGMGQVYLAEQISLKRKVALKLLHAELAADVRSLQRFKSEAENVALATHANIVQIYTIGEASGINYIALEYVEGKNLREFIEKKGTPELSLGLHIMAQVASALQRASELSVIHRDVKPENILLTKKGEVKVADFGLSRCFDESTSPQNLTQSQVTMGTPLYMSPEQVEHKAVDSRTDIYSFGVTCYHMFAGNPPFRGNSPIEVAYQHVIRQPPPLSEIRPDLPPDLSRIVHKMMAKKPEDRYQTAREVSRDITRLRESLNLDAIAAISMSSTFVGPSPDPSVNKTTQTLTIEPRRTSSSMGITIIFSIFLALALGLGFGWYQKRRTAAQNDLRQIALNPGHDDSGAVKILFNAKEREESLKKLVQEFSQPENQREVSTGLTHSVELGLFYLQEKKYDEAEQFFKQLTTQEPKIPAYRLLGRIGRPITLAFKDEYEESNKEFLMLIAEFERIEARIGSGVLLKRDRPFPKRDSFPAKDYIEAYRLLWKDDWKVREMVAKALQHNYANAPKQFPAAKLDAYRFPPQPTLKASSPMP